MEKVKSSARTWAEIDLDAIKHNLDIAKNQGMKVMCVIKGNAYGHGSVGCAKFLEENGADMFAVASCFFHHPVDVGNLISGSSAFSKTIWNIRNFTYC